MRKYFVPLTLVLVLLFSFAMVAQETTVKGNLSGLVEDASGAVVPGAKVTLSGPQGTRTATTDAGGRFYFGVLTPGAYSVKAESKGFKTAEYRNIEVFTNRTSNLQVRLEPGGATEVVEVTAAAVTVDTSSTAVVSMLNHEFYSNVPVARNVTCLFYASPGVNNGGGTGPANPSISGGSGIENHYAADIETISDCEISGIGIFYRVFGSLSAGIRLFFV